MGLLCYYALIELAKGIMRGSSMHYVPGWDEWVWHHGHVCMIAGDQTGHIRVWDLTANACSCELVPEIGTPVRSLSVANDGTMIVAANNHGTCYVWRMMRGEAPAWVVHGSVHGSVHGAVVSAV